MDRKLQPPTQGSGPRTRLRLTPGGKAVEALGGRMPLSKCWVPVGL